jgi:predicted Zn-dependent protease
MYGHGGYKTVTAQEAQRQETEADAFALEVMRRIAVPPLSMAHFFMLLSRLESSPADFATPEQYEVYLRQRASHPVSSQRILAVADALQANAASYARLQPNSQAWTQRVQLIASQVRVVGQNLDDRKMRRFLTDRAKSVAPASLRTGCK